MRIFGKLIVLTPCLLLGLSPLMRAPVVEGAPGKSAARPAALPTADETGCGFIQSAAGARRWAKAEVISGARISNAAALARMGDRPVIIYGAKLSGQRLAGARLSDVCFERSDLSRTDWRGVSARGVGAVQSNLRDAVMTGAGLQEAVFSDTQLDGVDASQANLAGARIAGGSLDGLGLRGARMRGFRLYCGLMVGDNECSWPNRGIDARDTDLTHAGFDVFGLENWDFGGALIDRTVVQFRQIQAFGSAAAKGPVILQSSGHDRSTGVRLTPAEWRQLLASDWTNGPDFPCGGARSVVERSICGSETLHWVDRQLGRVYRDALVSRTTTIGAQRRWLARRDDCAGKPDARFDRESCIMDAYNERLDDLRESLPVRSSFHPGEERFFISSEMVPPPAFRRTALYSRIFPILVATANTKLFVRAVGRDRVLAGAEAFGSNGHMCTLGGAVLDFDRSNGRFGARHSKDWLSRNPMPVREDLLKFVGEAAWVGPPDRGGWLSGEYAGCGARAGFSEMTRIPIPKSQRSAIANRGRALLEI